MVAVKIAILLLRIAFGGMFVYAGVLKQRDPLAFLEAVRGFRMLADPWAAWLAMGLPWLEIFCGACVMVGVMQRGALLILCGALASFIVAFVRAWATGLDIACGCFGEATPVEDYRLAILQRFAMLAAGALLFTLACLQARRVPAADSDPVAD